MTQTKRALALLEMLAKEQESRNIFVDLSDLRLYYLKMMNKSTIYNIAYNNHFKIRMSHKINPIKIKEKLLELPEVDGVRTLLEKDVELMFECGASTLRKHAVRNDIKLRIISGRPKKTRSKTKRYNALVTHLKNLENQFQNDEFYVTVDPNSYTFMGYNPVSVRNIGKEIGLNVHVSGECSKFQEDIKEIKKKYLKVKKEFSDMIRSMNNEENYHVNLEKMAKILGLEKEWEVDE